jgi:hypothetical protein
MESKTKCRKEECSARQSLWKLPDNKKIKDLQCKDAPGNGRGNETSRVFVDNIKPLIKKSSSHLSVEMQNPSKKLLPKGNSSKENLRISNQESLALRLSVQSKLSPSPVLIPINSSKFLSNLNRLEHKLTDFYITNESV